MGKTIDDQQFYMNRPTELMGCRLTFAISDSDLVESWDSDIQKVDEALREKYPNLSEIKTVRHGGWTYKGILMGGEDEADRRSDGE